MDRVSFMLVIRRQHLESLAQLFPIYHKPPRILSDNAEFVVYCRILELVTPVSWTAAECVY